MIRVLQGAQLGFTGGCYYSLILHTSISRIHIPWSTETQRTKPEKPGPIHKKEARSPSAIARKPGWPVEHLASISAKNGEGAIPVYGFVFRVGFRLLRFRI